MPAIKYYAPEVDKRLDAAHSHTNKGALDAYVGVKIAKGNPLDNVSVDFGPYHLVVARPAGGLGMVQLEAIDKTGSLPTDVVYVSNWGDNSTTVRNTWDWDFVARGNLGDDHIENLGGYNGCNIAKMTIYDKTAEKFYFVDLRIQSNGGMADGCTIYVKE